MFVCLYCHQQIQAYEDAMRQQRLSGWVSVMFKTAFTDLSGRISLHTLCCPETRMGEARFHEDI